MNLEMLRMTEEVVEALGCSESVQCSIDLSNSSTISKLATQSFNNYHTQQQRHTTPCPQTQRTNEVRHSNHGSEEKEGNQTCFLISFSLRCKAEAESISDKIF
jgi:hypothetical protein